MVPDCHRIQLLLLSFQSLTLHLLKSLMMLNLPVCVNNGSMLSNITTSRSKNSMLPFTGISGANIHSLLHHDFIQGSLGSGTTLISASSPVASSVRQWNW